MKRIFSVAYPDRAFDLAMLILRVFIGVAMAHHGYGKLIHFSEMQEKFMNFLGLGPAISLALVVFAEFFCSMLLVIGFMTRAALIPLIITMAVAVFSAHSGDIFGKGELASIYLAAYLALTLTGPGRYSIDGILSRK